MNDVFKYLLLAVAVVIPFAIISPNSVGGWVLFVAVSIGTVSAARLLHRRLVS